MDRLTHRVRGLVERGERISAEDGRALLDVRDLNVLSALSRIARERRFGKEGRFIAVSPVEVTTTRQVSEQISSGADASADVLLQPASTDLVDIESWGRHVSDSIKTIGERRVTARVDPEQLRSIYGESARLGLFMEHLGGASGLYLSGAGSFSGDPLWPDAATFEHWIATHQAVAELGITGEAGIVYHDAADLDLLAEQMTTIREVQDVTRHFRSFIPLPYTSESFEDAPHRRTPGSAMTLRISAIARIFFDNIDHISTPVRLVDPETSFVALNFGADIVDPSYRPSDARVSSKQNEQELLLPVVDNNRVEEADQLRFIEERIVEARFRPLPVDAFLEELTLVA